MADQRYLVTARKYRPARFNELVAQEHVSDTLKNALRLDRLAHAYLFSGPRGVGKTTTARILAKAINCETPLEDRDDGAEPCRTCDSCRSFEAGRSLNVFEMDAASNNKVDDIRELREKVRIPPQGSSRKVYILDEVHMLSTQAFNALLKTLEEPPAHALFIFATTEPHKVLATILSRCQRFDFRRIPPRKTVAHLRSICEEEGIEADEKSLMLIARKGNGALRDALSAFDQAISLCGTTLTYGELAQALGVVDQDLYFRLTQHIRERDTGGVLKLVHHVVRNGYDVQEFLAGVAEHLRNLLVARSLGPKALEDVAEATQQRYAKGAKAFREADLLRLLTLAGDAEETVKASAQPRLKVEMTLLKMAQIRRTADLGRVLQKLKRLEKMVETGELPERLPEAPVPPPQAENGASTDKDAPPSSSTPTTAEESGTEESGTEESGAPERTEAEAPDASPDHAAPPEAETPQTDAPPPDAAPSGGNALDEPVSTSASGDSSDAPPPVPGAPHPSESPSRDDAASSAGAEASEDAEASAAEASAAEASADRRGEDAEKNAGDKKDVSDPPSQKSETPSDDDAPGGSASGNGGGAGSSASGAGHTYDLFGSPALEQPPPNTASDTASENDPEADDAASPDAASPNASASDTPSPDAAPSTAEPSDAEPSTAEPSTAEPSDAASPGGVSPDPDASAATGTGQQSAPGAAPTARATARTPRDASSQTASGTATGPSSSGRSGPPARASANGDGQPSGGDAVVSASAPAATPLSDSDWNRFVNTVRDRSRRIWSVLSDSTPEGIHEGVLTIAVEQRFAQTQLREKASMLCDCLNRALDVEVTHVQVTVETAPKRKAAGRSTASRDPRERIVALRNTYDALNVLFREFGAEPTW